MHFHGVHYPFGSDGSFIPGFSGAGGDVMPGKTFTYQLRAGADSAGVWPYHDHSPSMMDSIAGGMYGALSILPAGVPRAKREFVTFFESHLGFETINGRAFVGNTPVLHSRVGDSVQWDVLALGDETTPSTSTATAGATPTARRSTARRSARRRRSRSASRRTGPGRGSTTATSSST